MILRLLVKKDIMTKQEYIDEMQELKKEMAKKGTVECKKNWTKKQRIYEEVHSWLSIDYVMKEKRKYPRFNTAIEVKDLATLRTGWTRNLSLGGCLIEKSEEFVFLPMASRLTLKFEIPGVNDLIAAFGIVRHRGKYTEGVGIQFEAIDKKSAYYIERFMGIFL